MPAFTETVVARESQPGVQLGADRECEKEIASVDATQILGNRKQRGQNDATRVNARRIVLVVEVERVRSRAFRESSCRRCVTTFADEAGCAACLLPAHEAGVELRDAGRMV